MEFEYKGMKFQVGILVPHNLIAATRTDNMKFNEYQNPQTGQPIRSYRYADIFSVDIPITDVYKGEMKEQAVLDSCYNELRDTIIEKLCIKIDSRLST